MKTRKTQSRVANFAADRYSAHGGGHFPRGISRALALAVAVSCASLLPINPAQAENPNTSGIDVIVKKDGKTVSRARTDAAGRFTTDNLEPAAYNVEFRSPGASHLKGQQVLLSISAGKQPAVQSAASGNHLGSGVAMNVQVSKPSKLIGKVTVAAGKAIAKTAAEPPAGMVKVKANVKVIDGKKYVWVPAPIGSHMGGKWVEAGTEGAALSTSNKKGGDSQVLGTMQDHSSNVGVQYDGFGSIKP